MWDCHTFQAYLKQIGKYEMWSERIYPGMQRAIIGTMLACQDNMDRRPNTFELYGADFMISEDFYPWLIEINASPDLAPSTSVTARLCPQAVEDTIKGKFVDFIFRLKVPESTICPFLVVIDRKIDQNADTGFFDMIYKQVIPKTPAYMGNITCYPIHHKIIIAQNYRIALKFYFFKIIWNQTQNFTAVLQICCH